MNLKKIMVLCALALGGLAVGCGNKCKSSCEDAKDCSGATAETKAEDCGKVCDDAEKLADKMDCSSEYDDYVSCVHGLDDICKFNPLTDCQKEAAAGNACTVKYCTAHPTDADCSSDSSS